MKTAVIGSGYVGPVSGALLADFGNSVRAYGGLDFTTDMKYAPEQYDALGNAGAQVILTYWSCFKSFIFGRAKKLITGKCFFDMRNIYKRLYVENAGFIYTGVGV